MIDTTVVLATHNGAAVLARTLAGYAAVAAADKGWKLVVVDNASTDATATVLAGFREKLPLTALEQPRPGKNRALNTALSSIEGDIVIFTDDDAIPQPGFLDAWRDTLAKQPDFDVFGGTIVPHFDTPPPDWLRRNEPLFASLFAARGCADGPIEPSGIFGPNMAVRRSVLATGLRFQEGIGPNSTDRDYPMGSETDFCLRASRAGHGTWFAARPIVHHIVRPHQVTTQFFRGRAYRLGRGLARLQWDSGVLVPKVRRHALVAACGAGWRRLNRYLLLAQTLRVDPARRYAAIWEYDLYRGFHDEYDRRRAAFRAAQPGKAVLLAG